MILKVYRILKKKPNNMHWKIKKKTISIIFNANFDTFDNIKPTPYSSQKKKSN